MITDSDTIAAIATPAGRGGIGIVKISGKDAFAIAQAVFRPLKIRPDESAGQRRQVAGIRDFKFETHRLYYGHIVDPKDDSLLDEVLISAMRAPKTYTREDFSHDLVAGLVVGMVTIPQAGKGLAIN